MERFHIRKFNKRKTGNQLAHAGMERDQFRQLEITVSFDKEIFENYNSKFWLNGSPPPPPPPPNIFAIM